MPIDPRWLGTHVTRPEHRALLEGIVTSDERLDARGFVNVLTDDAAFRFGSAPPVVGRAAIEQVVTAFFTTITAMRHDLEHVWEAPGLLAYEARVTYGVTGGSTLSLPYANVLRLRGDRVHDYRIYIDPTPMQGGK